MKQEKKYIINMPKIITIGKTAQNALNILNFSNFESIRHPSNDFKKEFPEQFRKYTN